MRGIPPLSGSSRTREEPTVGKAFGRRTRNGNPACISSPARHSRQWLCLEVSLNSNDIAMRAAQTASNAGRPRRAPVQHAWRGHDAICMTIGEKAQNS